MVQYAVIWCFISIQISRYFPFASEFSTSSTNYTPSLSAASLLALQLPVAACSHLSQSHSHFRNSDLGGSVSLSKTWPHLWVSQDQGHNHYENRTTIVADAELLNCQAEDITQEGRTMPRSMAIRHRQLQDQLAKLQHNIDTARTCLADTCQQLGVEISDYINEE